MKKGYLIATVIVLVLLAGASLAATASPASIGALPWYAWIGIVGLIGLAGVGYAWVDLNRTRRNGTGGAGEKAAGAEINAHLSPSDLARIVELEPNPPDYPHPVIFPERCIGCHACVEACPHDVLAMVGGIASVVAAEQCMEDTSCQLECPVNPKACLVVNTTRQIKPRPVPQRDVSFMTGVPGCYIIGDVSGTPLIKNAANEGTDVITHIAEELAAAPPEPKAELDVAIVGIGPGGLSAAITAKQKNMRFVGIEQDRVLSTIEAYPKGKYVFFKPETMPSRGAIAVEGAGQQREAILNGWLGAMRSSGVTINEGESCKSVKRAADGDYFTLTTERGEGKELVTYRARRVVLALGNRGTPMKLRVPGEEINVTLDGRTETKVKYKLEDPAAIRGRNVIVVGAGNSAIEAAVDLVARRDGDRITFRPDDEMNTVTLVIRSDLKNDLKFGNKQQVYEGIDSGRLKAHFGAAIKEIRDSEVVLMNARSKEPIATVPNDLVYALIGGDRPTKFLESIGIVIG
jgi:thioredoxin reductase